MDRVVHADIPLEGCKHVVTPTECIVYTCFEPTTHIPLVVLSTPQGEKKVHFLFGACPAHLTQVRLALLGNSLAPSNPFLTFVCGLLEVDESQCRIMRVTFEPAQVGSA